MIRREPFGITVALRRPEMLVLLRRRDLGDASLEPGAPFEAHLTIGHRCQNGCAGCYIDARPDAKDEMTLGNWCEVMERLAHMGVFHLALGGGELVDLELLVELAHRARRLGLTPNLSTGGSQVTPRLAKRLRVFRRIHISLDGPDEVLERQRGAQRLSAGLMALRILRAFHPRVGVNCVVTRDSIDKLPGWLARLSREGVRSIEILRFKPAGRGAAVWKQFAPRPEQLERLVPLSLSLSRRLHMFIRLDCSLAPWVCQAGYSPRLLQRLGIAGCVGGSWLVSVDGRGRLSGCSFAAESNPLDWRELGREDPSLPFRRFLERSPEPCASCAYLRLCRGGCRVVAQHVGGDFLAPDPDCPRVRDWARSGRGRHQLADGVEQVAQLDGFGQVQIRPGL